jgi:hypothetical protein
MMLNEDPMMTMVELTFPSAFCKRTFEEFCLGADDDCNSISSSDEDSLSDSEEEREENEMVKSIVSAAMAQPQSSLARLLSTHTARHANSSKRRCVAQPTPAKKPTRLVISESAPLLTLAALEGKSACETCENPDDFLRMMLEKNGLPYKTVSSLSLHNFFDTPTESYDLALIQAVRNQDIETLLLKHQLGQSMHCANQFGHTLLHAAARRGASDVVDFFLKEANDVTVKVVCDIGRTPLHDACWTAKPNFEIVAMLLDACPDLLFLTDNRGYTPLAYTSREHWGQWSLFLEQRGVDNLVPREI